MVPIYPTGGPRHAAAYPPLPPRPPLPPLSPPPPRRSRTGVVVSILVTAAVALAVGTAGGYAVGSGKAVAAASASASATRSTLFSSAVSSCGSPAGTQLGDGGRTLMLHTRGTKQRSSGMSVQDLRCILKKLGASDAVISRMSATRAIDGMQDGRWDGISASWTYHPDDGLNITLTMD